MLTRSFQVTGVSTNRKCLDIVGKAFLEGDWIEEMAAMAAKVGRSKGTKTYIFR